MRFTVEKELIQKGITSVHNAVAIRSTLPILSNILFETKNDKLKISATNMDLGITTEIKVKTLEEGSGTIPAKRVSDIIKELPESEVSVTMKKNNVFVIESGNSHFKIIGLPKEGFPDLPSPKKKNKISIEQQQLRKILTQTAFAVSHDETRYMLNGILFEVKGSKINFVATDGRRLAFSSLKLTESPAEDKKAIVPIKTAAELQKNLSDEGDAEIYIEENLVFFKLCETLIISRLIEGEYPNYNQVVPKDKGEIVKASREAVYAAIKRASLLSTAESIAVKLELSKDRMLIAKVTPEIGEYKDEIGVQYNGPSISIGFNPNYLLDVFKVLEDEEVEMDVSASTSPAVFRQPDYLYMVLPMQI